MDTTTHTETEQTGGEILRTPDRFFDFAWERKLTTLPSTQEPRVVVEAHITELRPALQYFPDPAEREKQKQRPDTFIPTGRSWQGIAYWQNSPKPALCLELSQQLTELMLSDETTEEQKAVLHAAFRQALQVETEAV